MNIELYNSINWSTNVVWSWHTIWTTMLFVAVGYLLGSILVSRTYISLVRGGNTTFTNKKTGKEYTLTRFGTSVTARSLGLKWGIIHFIWDFAKPMVAFWGFMYPLVQFGPEVFQSGIVSLGLLAVLIGNNWPIFWNFEGGIGVACGVGILVTINWIAGLIGFLTWLVVASVTGNSGLGGLAGTVIGISMMFIPYFIGHPLMHDFFRGDAQYVYMLIVMVTLMVYKHKYAIKSLINKIKNKK